MVTHIIFCLRNKNDNRRYVTSYESDNFEFVKKLLKFKKKIKSDDILLILLKTDDYIIEKLEEFDITFYNNRFSLDDRINYWINLLNSHKHGFNILKTVKKRNPVEKVFFNIKDIVTRLHFDEGKIPI